MDNNESFLFHLFHEPKEFLQLKFLKYRRSSSIVLALYLSFGLASWGWDWVVDPAHAMETLGLRLLFLFGLVLLPVFRGIRKKWVLILVYVAAICFLGEVPLLIALSRLDGGLLLGLGGYLVFVFITSLIFRCFSFPVVLLLTVLTACFPAIFALMIGLEGFDYLYYTAFVGPGIPAAVLVSIVLEVGDRRQYDAEALLQEASRTDTLTKLANRRYFMELLKARVREQKRYGIALSVIKLDIDLFKEVNDTYGYSVGDTVIYRLGEICRNSVRDMDIVARTGGEEFSILLPYTDTNCSRALAGRLRKNIERASIKLPGGGVLTVTACISVASMKETLDAEGLVQAADKALQQAKEVGSNQIVVI